MNLTALGGIAAISVAGLQAQPPRLELGQPVAREISAGESHTYRVALAAGQAMHIIVNQTGADVVLSLLDGSAKEVVQVDGPMGGTGPESAWLIAQTGGDYAIVVRPFDRNSKGRYEVRLDVLRVATTEDWRRVTMQDVVAEAARLRAQRTTESDRAAVEKLKEAITLARALDEMPTALVATQWLSTLNTGEAIKSLGMSALSGPIPVYYSAGYEQRATSLRTRLEKGVRFFERTLGVTPKIEMVVPSREDWDWLPALPYPTNWSRYARGAGLVGIAAAEDMAKAYLPVIRARLPAATIKELEATGTSFEDGMRETFNDLVYHELGHIYTSASSIGTPNLWLGELLADFLAHAFMAQETGRPGARLFEEIGLSWLEKSVKPAFTSLEDFDRVWVRLPPDNYAWYHAQFTRQAAAIYQARGLDFLKQVRLAFPVSENGPVPVDEVVRRLDKIAPGFLKWATSLAQKK